MKGIILWTLLLVSALGSSEQACPRSWTRMGTSCYVILQEPSSWIEARSLSCTSTLQTKDICEYKNDYCIAVGGYLAEINNAEENRFLTNFVNNVRAEGAWIGLNDLVEDGQFMWSTTQRAPSYTNFASDQPDNRNNQDCVWLTNKPISFTPSTWDDVACSNRFRFICQRSSQ